MNIFYVFEIFFSVYKFVLEKIETAISDITKILPEDLDILKDDLEKNIRATLNATFSKMELVTREEFDIQASLLSRTRAKLEALVEDLISRTIPPCKIALKDAGLTAGEISEVVLVGGMTRMPKVVEEVKNFFEIGRAHV